MSEKKGFSQSGSCSPKIMLEVEPSPMHGTDSFEALPSGAGADGRLFQDCSGFDGLRLYVDQHGTSLSVYLPLTG